MAALDSFKQMRDELAAGTKQQEVLLSFKGKGLKLNSADDADTKEVVKQISMATTITALELTGNTVGSEAAAAIGECLTKRTELKRALWSDMFTGRMKTEIPPALRSLTGALITAKANLTELDLSDNAFGAQGVEGFQVFLRSPAAYQLKVLKLNNNGLGIAGGHLLAKCLIDCHQASSAVGTPLSLTTFISGRNRLETPGATALAGAFAIIGTLERVEMIQNGIYHQGITALCTAFAKNKSLQIIDLSDNTFNQEGADSMAAVLPGLTQLESLSIGDCLLKTKGAEAVLKALEKHQRLRVLNLSGNEIGKDIVPSLTTAIRNKADLERVDLSSNQLGSATAEIELLAGSIDGGNDIFVVEDDEGSEEENEEENGEESDREAAGEEEVEGENLGPAEPECDQDVSEETRATFVSPLRRMAPMAAALAPVPQAEKILAKPKLDISFDRIINLRARAPEAILAQIGETLDDPECVVEALVKLAGFVTRKNEKALKLIIPCADALLTEAFQQCNAVRFCNLLLPQMGLLKFEGKSQGDCAFGLLSILKHAVNQPYFPSDSKAILRFIIEKRIDFVKNEKQLMTDLQSALTQ